MKENPYMQHIKVMELKVLVLKEAQSLLTDTLCEVGISEAVLKRSSSDIQKVLKLCDGLPLALNSVGKCAIRLYKRDVEPDEIWRSIASSMERCSKLPCTTEDMYRGLKFTYECFCNDKEKEAFLDVIFLTKIVTLVRCVDVWKRMEMHVGMTNLEHLHNVGLISKVLEIGNRNDEECNFVKVHDVFRVMGEQMNEERKCGIYITADEELKEVQKEALVAEMPRARYLFDVVIEGAIEEPDMENAYANLLALHAGYPFSNFVHW
ncbi:hypothetical protein KP509_32G019300 [Ceratopteris richardii]|uniref:Uncharacterized protein n=1 Tax=Ceratopteris richardii TaxID=49495 RepID=A0A8T2QSX2_CERRI|nr:hypothetical protein KP509_32G019300 [Ceratopteris richardii]